MSALKLLEMRSQRDVVLSIYCGFFLVITNFLFSQAIPLGIYMWACVWISWRRFVGFNPRGTPAPMSNACVRRRAAGAGAAADGAFFIPLPRAHGSAVGAAARLGAALSGLSDTMTPATSPT